MTNHEEIHYTDVKEWDWTYFTPKEIACKGTGLILINEDALDRLEAFRADLNVPFSPNSAYRSAKYNKKVGGAVGSQHLFGKAFDIPIKRGMTREKIHAAARRAGFTGFGDYNTFVHIDTGRPRYWDMRK